MQSHVSLETLKIIHWDVWIYGESLEKETSGRRAYKGAFEGLLRLSEGKSGVNGMARKWEHSYSFTDSSRQCIVKGGREVEEHMHTLEGKMPGEEKDS